MWNKKKPENQGEYNLVLPESIKQRQRVEFMGIGTGEKVRITFDEVMYFIARGQPNPPSEREGLHFLAFCGHYRANPYLSEAFLIKYSVNHPAAFVLGVSFYEKCAQIEPTFRGYTSGIILRRKDPMKLTDSTLATLIDKGIITTITDLPIVMRSLEFEEPEGCFVPPGAECLGAWCAPMIQDRVVTRWRVNLDRWIKYKGTGADRVPTKIWSENAPDQIHKVAISQGLRHAVRPLAGSETKEEFYARGGDEPDAITYTEPESSDFYQAQLTGLLLERGFESDGTEMDKYIDMLTSTIRESDSSMTKSDVCKGAIAQIEKCDDGLSAWIDGFNEFTGKKSPPPRPPTGQSVEAEHKGGPTQQADLIGVPGEETNREPPPIGGNPEASAEPSSMEQWIAILGENNLAEAWAAFLNLSGTQECYKPNANVETEVIKRLEEWWKSLKPAQQKNMAGGKVIFNENQKRDLKEKILGLEVS
jgi:hypothetical protein